MDWIDFILRDDIYLYDYCFDIFNESVSHRSIGEKNIVKLQIFEALKADPLKNNIQYNSIC